MLAGREKDVLKHKFCMHIDVKALVQKQIRPPWVPNLKSASDTNYDDFPEPSGSKRFDKYLDPQLEEMWEREFGAHPDDAA